MNTALNTEVVIEALVAANCGEDGSARERHLYRQALLSLVRLAKSEQIAEMKASAERLAAPAMPVAACA